MPVTPQKEAGWRTLPPVSVPSAAGTIWPPPQPREPPLEPPGTRDRSQGLWVDAVGGILGGGAHGEFIGIGLAQRHHARVQQFLHRGGVERRHEILQDL